MGATQEARPAAVSAPGGGIERRGPAAVALADFAFPAYHQRAPWWGPDLQTIRSRLRAKHGSLDRRGVQRLTLPVRDGSGDSLAAWLHPAPPGSRAPLAVLIHGLAGSAESPSIRQTAAVLIGAGFPVVRLDLRGAGGSRTLCHSLYHAGRSSDLRDALVALGQRGLAERFVLVGHSMGGNVLLKLLGEYAHAHPGVLGAVSVSAPIDLAASARRFAAPRNRIYQTYILRGLKADALGAGAALSPHERAAIASSRSVFEFDDRFMAPHNGYASAAHYYRENSGARLLGSIRVPTLVIHALDDPWVPRESYVEVDWARNPWLIPLISRRGGHVGFHMAGARTQWHDLCTRRFLLGVCGVGR